MFSYENLNYFSGGLGVAGSNPAAPTTLRLRLRVTYAG